MGHTGDEFILASSLRLSFSIILLMSSAILFSLSAIKANSS